MNMSCSSEFHTASTMSSSNSKITALESTLHISIGYCQDLMKQFEQISIESEEYKKQYNTLKEKCESKQCISSEELKKDIETKSNIIQSVASTLTKLYDTKNFSILNDVFKILCGEKITNIPILDTEIKDKNSNIKREFLTPKKEVFTPKKDNIFSPIKEVFNIKADVSSKDESLSEIDGTPTGRTSPIIPSRKLRNNSTASSTGSRDKKKCPESWPTPENKAVKLTFPSPSARGTGRLRQSRLNLMRLKPSNVVDLTCSPEHMTQHRNSQSDIVQPLVKKESTDNDDTILPSPTSGPNNIMSMYKTSSVFSPIKSKKQALPFKCSSEIQKPVARCDLENTPVKDVDNCIDKAEESINLLKPARFLSMLDDHSPINVKLIDEDETHCEIPSSISILQDVNIKLEKDNDALPVSPIKIPLGENKNITNVPEEPDSSMSLLRQVKVSATEEKIKRQLSCKRTSPPDPPPYKEQLPRTKAEKRKLRGWNCDQCKNFYDELYKDDPEMLALKMDECSKHRGKNNPARPKTPEGFWNPRWSVPNDTEEFNRRNNAE